MTPNEITTVLTAPYGKVFDTPFKLMLMERVDIWRSRHIRNALEKQPQDRKFFKSTIYLSLQESSTIECDVPVNCKIWRTDKLPGILRANSILFDYVGAINGMNPFSYTEAGMVQYKNKGKYSSKVIPYLYQNNRLYLLENVPMIRVDFVPDKPSELEAYTCGGDSGTCDFWNAPYPCTNEILQLILQSIREIDFREAPLQKELSVAVNPANDNQQ
jgi:hypothetical protein